MPVWSVIKDCWDRSWKICRKVQLATARGGKSQKCQSTLIFISCHGRRMLFLIHVIELLYIPWPFKWWWHQIFLDGHWKRLMNQTHKIGCKWREGFCINETITRQKYLSSSKLVSRNERRKCVRVNKQILSLYLSLRISITPPTTTFSSFWKTRTLPPIFCSFLYILLLQKLIWEMLFSDC